jgi:hypothetical protein
MNARAIDLRLYVVTDREQAGARGLIATVTAAVEGGATVVQLRDKHASTRELIEQARALRVVCARRGVPLIINDRVDVAMAADADRARAWGGSPSIQGRRLGVARAIAEQRVVLRLVERVLVQHAVWGALVGKLTHGGQSSNDIAVARVGRMRDFAGMG